MKKSKSKIGLSFVCILALFIVCVRFVAVPSFMYPLKYKEYVEKYSKEYGIEKELIYAVIKTESGFKKDALSKKGAVGLMQIIESTADWIIEESDIDAQRDEYKNPEINIQMGSWYLRYLLDYFGEKEVSLAAYNAGMGNVNKWLKNEKYSKDGKSLIKIPFKETRDYVRKVLMSEEIYKLLYFK